MLQTDRLKGQITKKYEDALVTDFHLHHDKSRYRLRHVDLRRTFALATAIVFAGLIIIPLSGLILPPTASNL